MTEIAALTNETNREMAELRHEVEMLTRALAESRRRTERKKVPCPRECGNSKTVEASVCALCANRDRSDSQRQSLVGRKGAIARARAMGQRVWDDISADERDMVRHRYEIDGDTCSVIAPAFGVTADTVANWLKYMGVTLRQRGRRGVRPRRRSMAVTSGARR